MTFVIDAILVILFVLCVWLGFKRGFIKTFSGLIALVVAILLASILSGPVAEAVYTDMVYPPVLSTLEQHVTGEMIPTAAEVDTALENLPDFVAALLKSGGMENGAAVVAKIEAIAPGSTAARTVADVVITPIVLPLLQMLISVILFLLAYVVASILLRALDVVAKLPLLKQLNHLLGLAAGTLTGALWVIFLARLLFVLAWLGVAAWLSPDVLEGTWLASFANGLIPTFEV